MWSQETVMKKKIRWRGEWTDRQAKYWSEEVMTDGTRIPAHVPEECEGNDGPRCCLAACATHPSCHYSQSIDNVA